MGDQFAGFSDAALRQRDNGDDLWPQRSLGRPVTTTSSTAGCDAIAVLDLFDEDLLTAGVDGHRVAAQ